MMKFTRLICILPLLIISWGLQAQTQNIIANPINLNYRFQPDAPSRREAADPVCEYFNGKYYLFASKSGGYWSSTDLAEWTFIPCKSIGSIEEYAPTILILDDVMYYMASGTPRIYYTSNPDVDNWKALTTRFEHWITDPALFKDEDTGKVYLYWGCSDNDPIMGVEVDPANGFKSIGTPVELIQHNEFQYGWEAPGENNQEKQKGWNEGPTMNKYNGNYYLQYAAPGTGYRIYADGVYVGDQPLGPFTYMENSPFSFKPGGFIGGAGHSHTFQDKYGNYWHVATMKISVRHMFERRIGLFPAYFSENGELHTHTVWTDYPFYIPEGKIDLQSTDCSMNWNLLSFGKQVEASSSYLKYVPENANDEQVETWWAAESGEKGEWWQVDLGKPMEVKAIQVNFADQDFSNRASNSYVFYQYRIDISEDGEEWKPLIDRSQNTKDMPHELIVAEHPEMTRFLRITNERNVDGKFSLSGFRVFGLDQAELPGKVSGFQAKRVYADNKRFRLDWNQQENTTGYILRWGINENQLDNAIMVMGNSREAGFFGRDSRYFFSIDAFNESGITAGEEPIEGTIYLGSPYGGQYWPAPGTIEAEDFNEGGLYFGYYKVSIENKRRTYRPEEYVDITTNRLDDIYVTNTLTNDCLNYSFEAEQEGTYEMDCIVSSSDRYNLGHFYLEFDGEKKQTPDVMEVPYGSSSNFQSVTVKDIYLTKGVHVMTFNIIGSLHIDKFIFKLQQSNIETPQQHPVSVSPTLSSGIFNIESSQPGVLSVLDGNGRLVYTGKMTNLRQTIDLVKQPSGIYIVWLKTDEQSYRIKLVKT